MIPEDAQLFSLVVSVNCFEWDLEVCDEKIHGVEIIAAMAVSWENKRLSQNLAIIFPKRAMFNGIWAVALFVSLYFRKKMVAHLVTIYQKAKNTLQWFPANWKNTSRTPEPHLWCFFGRTIYGRQKHSRPIKKHSPALLQGHEQAAGFITLGWDHHGEYDEMISQKKSLLCQHALHLQVPSSFLQGVWVLKPHPPTGEHETCKLKFDSGMFLLLLLVVLFDESSHQGNQTRRKTHDVSPKVQTCKPESSLTKNSTWKHTGGFSKKGLWYIYIYGFGYFLSHVFQLEKTVQPYMFSTQNMEALRILRGSTFEEEFDLVALEQTDTHSRIRDIHLHACWW